MSSTSEASKERYAIDWRARVGGHRVTRTLIVSAYVQPTRHLAYSLAKADAQNYAKGSLLEHIVVLGVRGVGRRGYYSTKESPGFSN